MPRLLFVATSKNDGGVERYSVRMATELHRRGRAVLFACLPGEIIDRRCREAGIPTLPFSVRNSGDFGAARRLADVIRAEKIGLVHVHSRRDYVPAVLGVALARRRRRSPRLILHAHMLRALGEPLGLSGRLFGAVADVVLAVSTAVRDHLLRAHGLAPSFVRLLCNGVDLALFPERGDADASAGGAAWRRAWGMPADALVIGMVGRLDAKGQAFLLRAAPALLAQFPALWFVFVGAEGEPGEQRRLQDTGDAGGFGGRLVFVGPRDDVPSLLPALDVLAHLPTDEAFGLALLDAMAAGLPTVATDIGGCREVVRDGVTGALVTPGDVAMLTGALSGLLAAPERRSLWGDAGRRAAEQDFSLARQIDALEAIYAEQQTSCVSPQD